MEVVNETLVAKMGSLTQESNTSDGVDCSYGTYGIFVVVVVFQFINWVIKTVGPPKSLRDDEWKWRNITISWLHALVCVLWCISCLVVHPEIMQDPQHYRTYLNVFLITFTTGYFLYDFLDLALNGKMISMWEVQLHHVAVGGMFFYNLVNCEWLGFTIIPLLVEVQSFFLHQRKVLQMLGTPYTSRLYRLTIHLNITTFVIFRGAPLIIILWAMTQWYNEVTLTYFLCMVASMLVMLVMNPILFMRLLRSDYLRGRSSARREVKFADGVKGKVAVNGNNNHLESNGQNHVKQS